MTRDHDLDALAEALERAQQDQPSWLARWLRRLARRFLVAAAGPLTAATIVTGVLVPWLGVDPGWLLRALLYGSPFLAIAVASFVVHAWRQNTGLTWTPQESQADLATEPGQVDQPQVGHVEPDLARPRVSLPPATVTVVGVTALPAPAAALPHAVGQATPIQSADEEDTP